MSSRAASVALLAAALSAAPAAAQPGGSMKIVAPPGSPSDIIYGENNGPTSETTPGPGTATLMPGTGVKQLNTNWWFYRVQGDSRERPFGAYTKSDGFTITGTSSWPSPITGGNTATYTWIENGASGPRFTAGYTMVLSSGGGTTAYDARLDQSFQINNPNPSPLTISLFNFVYWDLEGDFNTQVGAAGDSNSISVTDGLYQDTHTATAVRVSGRARPRADQHPHRR
jgi:hypothetical protein